MHSKAWLSLVLVIFCVLCLEHVSGQTQQKQHKRWWWSRSKPKKCQFEGVEYKIGDVVQSYSKSTNTCYIRKCQASGEMTIIQSLQNCRTTQTTPTTTTPRMTTVAGCNYHGTIYKLGSLIDKGQSGNWCWETRCDYSGHVVSGDDFNCNPTTTPPPTPTTPPTTPPYGCYKNGKHYPPGSEISHGQTGNWCYWEFCGENGEILHGDDFNCGDTTTEPTTTSSTTSSTTSATSTTTPDEAERQLLARLRDLIKQQR